jgi:hypothetical protein
MPFRTNRRLLLHTTTLCVFVLLLAGVIQAAHVHGPDRGNPSHCATCVAAKAPATLVSSAQVLAVAAIIGQIVTAEVVLIQSRESISSYIRPPPVVL